MGKLLKFVLLSFAIVLSFGSAGEGQGVAVPDTSFQNVHDAYAQSYRSVGKLNKIYCLHRSCEIVVNPANNFPVPGSKKNQDNFFNRWFSVELWIQNIASQYLSHAKGIQRSLTIADIIFPFHYFW
jgi:hypothetical protein